MKDYDGSATYIGPEEQFKGRTAHVFRHNGIVNAQFDEGKVWERYSRLMFDATDWDFDGEDE